MPGFPTVSPRSLDPMISMHAYAALSRSPVVPAPIDAPRELLEQLIGNRFIIPRGDEFELVNFGIKLTTNVED